MNRRFIQGNLVNIVKSNEIYGTGAMSCPHSPSPLPASGAEAPFQAKVAKKMGLPSPQLQSMAMVAPWEGQALAAFITLHSGL